MHFLPPPHTNLTFACFFFCCPSSVTKRRKAHLKRLDRRWTLGGIVNRQQSRGEHGDSAWPFKLKFINYTMTHNQHKYIHYNMIILGDDKMSCKNKYAASHHSQRLIYLRKLAELDPHLWGSSSWHGVCTGAAIWVAVSQRPQWILTSHLIKPGCYGAHTEQQNNWTAFGLIKANQFPLLKSSMPNVRQAVPT